MNATIIHYSSTDKKKFRKSGGIEVICKHLLQGRSEENCEPLLCTDIPENTPRQ